MDNNSTGTPIAQKAWAETGVSDYPQFTWDHNQNGAPANAAFCGVMIRYTDDSNFWLLRVDSVNGLSIYENNAGVGTLRANTAVAYDGVYTMNIVSNGTTITITAESNTATYNSATFNQTATKIGLSAPAADLGAAATVLWDNIEVYG